MRNLIRNVKLTIVYFQGYIIDRIKDEIERNDLTDNNQSNFKGQRGQSQLFGSMMDLFLASNFYV